MPWYVNPALCAAESQLLEEQTRDVKEAAVQVSQLRRAASASSRCVCDAVLARRRDCGGAIAAQFVPQSCLLQMTLGLFYGEQAIHSWSNNCWCFRSSPRSSTSTSATQVRPAMEHGSCKDMRAGSLCTMCERSAAAELHFCNMSESGVFEVSINVLCIA